VSDSGGESVARGRLRSTISYAVIGAMAVAAVILGVVVYTIREERASTECGFTPPSREELPGTGWHVDWEWTPPGFICVYTDDRGNVVARRPP
jgi:hypothetical protein